MITPPFGSALNDLNVRNAMQNLGQTVQNGHSALFVAKNVLNGGELSPHMSARFDQPRYQTGSEKLLNMVPMPQGGITKRPGFKHVGVPARAQEGEGVVRLFPFIFSAGESRILEFSGDDEGVVMRVWMPGGELTGEVDAPFVLDLPGWSAEDLATLCMAQSADVLFLAQENHPPAKISRYADNDWRYEEISWMPSIEAPVITSIRTVGSIPEGENSRTSYSYVATAVDGITGEESAASEPAEIEEAAPLSQTYYVEICVSPVPGAAEYRIYKKKGGVYGYVGRIPGESSSGSLEQNARATGGEQDAGAILNAAR